MTSNGGRKPRLLDLFCGAGGAAMGYSRAGFEVVGVDIKPQPNYPFEFIQADALEILANPAMGNSWFDIDAIHASPPCQRYSTATKRNGTQDEHPDLIGPTRELLEATGLPYVIENVVGAPLYDSILLCGSWFALGADGYRLKRHRLFETSWHQWGWAERLRCRCDRYTSPVMDVTGGGPTKKPRTDGGGGRPYKGTADQARRIMGIDWMTKAELNEAIPPAYTEFIGTQLMAHLRAMARVEIPATDLTSAMHALPGRPRPMRSARNCSEASGVPEASKSGSALSVLNGDDLAVIWDDVVGAISLALNDYDTETLEAVAKHAEEINAEGWLAKVIREYLMVWRGL